MKAGGLLVLLLAGAASLAAQPRRSGYDDMSPALQAMQRDETQNPAMLWVREGEALWSQAAANGRSCAGCHAGDAAPGGSLQGVAARYPRYDTGRQRPLTLAARIDQCRQQHQQAAPQATDGPQVLALTAALTWQSRGLPLAPDSDARLDAWQQRGRQLFQQRFGQLNLACTHCHEQRAGQRLGGALIPQAHPTGVPSYRLEWQDLGSLQRRLRSCLVGVRAEPFAPGADEWLALEVFLVRRAAGMAVEGAAVRP
ncbi:sulfur oxidation c-type cytochrome SoxA [Aquabacterium sp.]|uniref:sulfur oxidation c-type cytochrome SoxA n=1 Tax=Aquabacterium sp. TaxID=1872578 RepID=UPI002B883EFF|nr:sulfur oxidation c-type cytochrome SoxA [Aquabacterium sp.]HSW03002.1 sulfur oxidation c-type cytochrome SoxA [Aquabacterium sp.]